MLACFERAREPALGSGVVEGKGEGDAGEGGVAAGEGDVDVAAAVLLKCLIISQYVLSCAGLISELLLQL